MIALDRRSRAAVATVALAAFAAAVVMTANAGTGASDAGGEVAPAAVPLVLATHDAATLPHRDPFAGGVPLAKPAGSPALPALPRIPAAVGALPANLRAGGDARVTAIVTGAHPSALVEAGDTVRLLVPGDAFRDDRVVTIDGAGVHLAHGGTLRVTPAASLPIMPAPPGGRP